MNIRRQTPSEVAARLDSDTPPLLIDVRTVGEHRIAAIEGAQLIPLDTLAARAFELDPDRPLVLVCHHGMRSMQAAMFLAQRGFEDLTNLTGGIDRWSVEVDPSVPRY